MKQLWLLPLQYQQRLYDPEGKVLRHQTSPQSPQKRWTKWKKQTMNYWHLHAKHCLSHLLLSLIKK